LNIITEKKDKSDLKHFFSTFSQVSFETNFRSERDGKKEGKKNLKQIIESHS